MLPVPPAFSIFPFLEPLVSLTPRQPISIILVPQRFSWPPLPLPISSPQLLFLIFLILISLFRQPPARVSISRLPQLIFWPPLLRRSFSLQPLPLTFSFRLLQQLFFASQLPRPRVSVALLRQRSPQVFDARELPPPLSAFSLLPPLIFFLLLLFISIPLLPSTSFLLPLWPISPLQRSWQLLTPLQFVLLPALRRYVWPLILQRFFWPRVVFGVRPLLLRV